MDINNLQRTPSYSYEVDTGRIKQRLQQNDKSSSANKRQGDSVDISEKGRNALQEKVSAMKRLGQIEDTKKLSSLNSGSYGMMNNFEKVMSELGGGSVSDEFVTKDYSQADVDALKARFEETEGVKTDTFDSYVNKMASAYQLMKDRIEEKYAASDRQKEYYVADDGSIQELTKEKELEMLDKAYEKHSIFMATSTEIWADLNDFQPQITYSSNAGQAATSETQAFQSGYKKNEIKNQAYQAFMSAISGENRNMLLQEQGNLNHLKLNLNISSSARTQINSIWDYYANQKH